MPSDTFISPPYLHASMISAATIVPIASAPATKHVSVS
jgi:hypothetical protein